MLVVIFLSKPVMSQNIIKYQQKTKIDLRLNKSIENQKVLFKKTKLESDNFEIKISHD
jgi:hypothetical protein